MFPVAPWPRLPCGRPSAGSHWKPPQTSLKFCPIGLVSAPPRLQLRVVPALIVLLRL